MYDPPLTQSEEHHIRDAWIWAASLIAVLIAVAALLTVTGLVPSAANQSSQDADAGTVSGQQMVRLVLER